MVIIEDDVVIITLTQEAIVRAEERARLKQNHVDTWLRRNTDERREDFLYGQFGEEGFRAFLEQNNIRYIYYDDVRTDNFERTDLYDFKLLDANGNEVAEVSVKASIMDWELEPTVAHKNILAYPNEVKDITTQPFVNIANRTVFLSGWERRAIMETMPIGTLSHSTTARYHKRRIREAIPMAELVDYYRGLCNNENDSKTPK